MALEKNPLSWEVTRSREEREVLGLLASRYVPCLMFVRQALITPFRVRKSSTDLFRQCELSVAHLLSMGGELP
jgi:hypothetical protein